jgi:hypothetical protein
MWGEGSENGLQAAEGVHRPEGIRLAQWIMVKKLCASRYNTRNWLLQKPPLKCITSSKYNIEAQILAYFSNESRQKERKILL